MEILAIIPARGGSKGIPRKNIRLLNEKPLIYYSIKAANESKYVTRAVVSTEDDEIAKIAKEVCGCEVVKRPMDLAEDTTKTAPVLLQVVESLAKTENYHPDIVILLQATCPLRSAKQIDEAFDLFFNNECDSMFSAFSIGVTHALWMETAPQKYVGLYDYRNRPRRQDVDKHRKMFCENGAIYIIKTDIMKKVRDFIGETPLIYEMSQSIDIDKEEDFVEAEKILVKNS